jgi:hypothetical protein
MVIDVWHTELHTAEPLLLEPRSLQVDAVIEKLKT